MILIDTNQCMISNLMMQLKLDKNKLDENLVRHMVLTTVKSYKKRFSREYGELVFCYDSKHYWRKEVFPFYKQNRKKDREESELNWNDIFDCLNKIRDEIRDNFPYKVMEVHGAEADDIIAVLCKQQALKNIELQKQNKKPEKVLVLSGDKDFIQLKKYPFVYQYNPTQKKFIDKVDPVLYVKEHIIKGDRSDGIPNFLSDDDTFVSGKRQRPMSKKNLEKWIHSEPTSFMSEVQLKNYKRNQVLVDLDFIPENIQDKILSEFEGLNNLERKTVNLNYFINNKLFSLMNELENF